MMRVHLWDEISCEWQQVDLDIRWDSSPEEIVRAVDEATFQPLGFLPSTELWSLENFSQTGPLVTIECRISRHHLGIILLNLRENGIRMPGSEFPRRVLAQSNGNRESSWDEKQESFG